MPKVSDYYFKAGIVFLIIGIAMGMHMSISGNHGITGAHAHLNLVGWVTSALFGTYFALAPLKAARRLAMIQFGTHVAGVVAMIVGLYMLLSGNPVFEPLLVIGSVIVSLSVLLFAFMVFSR